jgi:hypothetical protein
MSSRVGLAICRENLHSVGTPANLRALRIFPRGCISATVIGEYSMAPDVSLEFIVDGRPLFASTGKWLHPLFELERFLAERGIAGASGEIRDKVVGRGSAFLIVRLGVRKVHAVLLSTLGKDVLDRAGVALTWDTLVDEIACRTEGILREVTDADEAYRILAERARKAREFHTAP